jgi:branched-chain amino acid transport system permease protein
METFVQLLLNSLIAGSTYALISLGYAMVYSILRFLNWAHGYIVMLGAFIAYTLIVNLKMNFIVAFILSVAICAIIAVLIELIGYRPLRKARRLAPTISGLGIAFLIQAIVQLIWGTDPRSYPRTVEVGFNIFGARITNIQIIIIIVSTILLLALRWVVYKSSLGFKIRAAADDLEMTAMLGINSNYVISCVFAIGGALAAAAGILVAWDTSLVTTIGLTITMKSFVAVILGGFGSIDGAIIGGMIIGFAENFGVWFIPAVWKDSIAYIILVIVLLIRPSGIAGVVSETEV